MTRNAPSHFRLALFAAALLAASIAASSPSGTPPRPMGGHPSAHVFAKPPVTLPASRTTLQDDAVSARLREDEGAYGQAVKQLRALRGHTAPDADLELWLAIDEARFGMTDSAWARLNTPLLSAAMADTVPPARYQDYGARRALQWIDGRFTGWHWYVAHARAEVAMETGDWNAAVAAARVAVAAQPLVGREHLLLALAAGRAGDAATARREAERAAVLDPLLPEARYVSGLCAWRAGDRVAARAAFESAIAADSGYREPALALVRMQLPGARPDSLPGSYLTGVRRVAMLTSPEQPKPEEDVASDTPAGLYGQSAPSLTVPDSLARIMRLTRPIEFVVTVLVDERGRPALSYLPYLDPATFPEPILLQVMQTAATWRFRPATRFGRPVRAWISVEYMLSPHS